MRKNLILAVGMMLIASIFATVILAQTDTSTDDTSPAVMSDTQHLLGGNTTIFNTTENAFTFNSPALDRYARLEFFVGDSFFNQNWVTAPASTTARDGLGPLFNARSCASCHFKDGRGRPPEFDGESPTGFLVRLSTNERDLTGAYLGDTHYGGQFQENALEGLSYEGSLRIIYNDIAGEFADGTPYTLREPVIYLEDLMYGDLNPEINISPRVANQMIGLGLLEAIPEETILSFADPSDADNDGISGRPNYVWDAYNNQRSIGRFGWKANQPSLLQQNAAAFNGDIGITTSLFPEENCLPLQISCQDFISGGEPEISDDDLLQVTLYTQTIAVPAQRDYDTPEVQRGYELFVATNCNACHIETIETGIHPTIPSLSNQTIHPYTDLLLHDMGEGLADDAPDFEATGSEWRTPPLWGIGLFETVNGHTYYLHDGRARNLSEAILWHGGEAEASRDTYLNMSAEDRDALIAFLRSL
ncbi:MAG: di-heme oxidoredictase family protein [Chloroflexota bacterium]